MSRNLHHFRVYTSIVPAVAVDAAEVDHGGVGGDGLVSGVACPRLP